jgi:post-segregation antitoxin (ccd killing protein)
VNKIQSARTEGPEHTQLSVPSSLLAQAQELGVDAVQAATAGIQRAVMNAQVSRYVEEHRAAADAWNHYITKNGLPFGDIMEQPS